MYYDEDLLLDIRLNSLEKFVKKFVITEATYTHNGENKKLNFDINKFKKFKDKIIYLVYEQNPSKFKEINSNDSDFIKSCKYIENAAFRENGQRNFINQALSDANNEDIILVSDVDEIPNLENINLMKKIQR